MRGVPAGKVMAELFSRADGMSRGARYWFWARVWFWLDVLASRQSCWCSG